MLTGFSTQSILPTKLYSMIILRSIQKVCEVGYCEETAKFWDQLLTKTIYKLQRSNKNAVGVNKVSHLLRWARVEIWQLHSISWVSTNRLAWRWPASMCCRSSACTRTTTMLPVQKVTLARLQNLNARTLQAKLMETSPWKFSLKEIKLTKLLKKT